jgi:hypothetical protein
MLNKRLQIVLSEEQLAQLEILTEENTPENKSLLVRRLIERAWGNPRDFGLRIPKADTLTLEKA